MVASDANDTLTGGAAGGAAAGATEQEARFFLALRASKQSLWEWDPDGDIITIDGDFWHRIDRMDLGPSLKREQFLDILDDQDRDRVNAALETMVSASAAAGRPLNLDFRVPCDDGPVEFTLSVGIYRGTDGSRQLITGLLRDASELKHLQRRLLEVADEARRASAAKSNFVAMMSHEIRTPLNGIIGMTELVLDGTLDDQQRAYIKTVRKSGSLLLRIVNDILDFSKIEAGRLELEQVAIKLPELIESAVQLCAPRTQGKDVAVVYQATDLPHKRYVGDPTRLRQILINLIGNAIKFTDQGSVTVRCTPEDAADGSQHLRFSVTDTGIGIPPENLDKLFDEFVQADMSVTRRYGGTGLGLAICKRLVEAMNGEIGVRSEVGKGSTFWFQLPLPKARAGDVREEDLSGSEPAAAAPEEPVEEAAMVAASPAAPPSSRKVRILVAEDNKVNQAVITALLLRAGFPMDLVPDGKAALAAVQKTDYGLVLMDLHMPEMDGLEATRRIRSLPADKADVPIIALSAEMMEGDRPMLEAAQFNDHVTKPIDRAKLFATIEKWLAEGEPAAQKASA